MNALGETAKEPANEFVRKTEFENSYIVMRKDTLKYCLNIMQILSETEVAVLLRGLNVKKSNERVPQPPIQQSRDFSGRAVRLNRTMSLSFIMFGVLALISSAVYASLVLAFVGLGLTFWGALLLYVSPEEYVKAALLEATTIASLTSFDELLRGNYEGRAVYLPPKYLADFESSRVYLTAEKTIEPPILDKIQRRENEIAFSNPESILVTPPGIDLARLFEKRLKTSFTKIDLHFLESHLPQLFTKDLEIAEKMEMTVERGKVTVKMVNSVYKDIGRELDRVRNVVSSIGCPIGSSIACALAKATGQPIVIGKYQLSDNGKTTEIEYLMLGEGAEGQIEK